MIASYAGCVPKTVYGERGVLTWELIQKKLAPKIYYKAQTGLIWMENTANIAGGTVTPLDVMEEVWDGARDAGLPTHLDGARIFNAATALDMDVATLTRGFDTVMFCLSKGLGAPVGSMLVGSKKNMEKARVYRKALGGGMRQAGVLAAAGMIALEEMPLRLHEDHANARMLAEVLAQCRHAGIDMDGVQSNIVVFQCEDSGKVAAGLKERGILVSVIGPQTVRLVTHFDVGREACESAAAALRELLD